MACRICANTTLKTFLDLGETPLANSFQEKEDAQEKTYPLALCFCERCALVQLTYVVPPEEMFSHYVYVSGTSKTFQDHFAAMATNLTEQFSLNAENLAVDIGSNDGILLKGFQKHNVQVMGVEPATNIAKMANESGVDTINAFFNADVVGEIIAKKGKADVITANNVFAHIPDIDSVVENVKKLLKNNGVFVIEFQYFMDTIRTMTFDNVYHEHLSYYTVTALEYFFKKHEMEIIDLVPTKTHGGSIRMFVQQIGGSHEIKPIVNSYLQEEKKAGVEGFDFYANFAQKVQDIKENLVKTLAEIKSEGKTIVGFGAPAKSTTLLNYCGLGQETLMYIVDENPLKQGLFHPGTKIPVVPSQTLETDTPDYVLVLAWNFADEILKKLEPYRTKGLQCVIPLPEIKIV